MRAREYSVLTRAVEDGVAYGWCRAHKHTSTPSPEAVQDALVIAVVSEICTWFEFDHPPDEKEGA